MEKLKLFCMAKGKNVTTDKYKIKKVGGGRRLAIFEEGGDKYVRFLGKEKKE